MNCPYCGTENPADAKECLNCSADLASLPKGTPPPESTAPTMMSSSEEVAAMLAAAKAEKEPEPEPPAEESPAVSDFAAPTMMSSSAEVAAMLAAAKAENEPEPEPPVEEAPAVPDFAAPTMMSSSAEIASMLAAAQSGEESAAEVSEEESLVEEPSQETSPPEAEPLDTPVFDEMMESADSSAEESGEEPEAEEIDAPVDMPSPVSFAHPENFAPTMISNMPDEVAAAIAGAKSGGTPELPEEEISGPVEMEPILEPAAVTMAGIPDPLGAMDEEEKPPAVEKPKRSSTFVETPTPLFNEPLPEIPVPAAPVHTEEPVPEAPQKDNRLLYVLGGCGCLTLLCICSVFGVVLLMNIQV